MHTGRGAPVQGSGPRWLVEAAVLTHSSQALLPTSFRNPGSSEMSFSAACKAVRFADTLASSQSNLTPSLKAAFLSIDIYGVVLPSWRKRRTTTSREALALARFEKSRTGPDAWLGHYAAYPADLRTKFCGSKKVRCTPRSIAWSRSDGSPPSGVLVKTIAAPASIGSLRWAGSS